MRAIRHGHTRDEPLLYEDVAVGMTYRVVAHDNGCPEDCGGYVNYGWMKLTALTDTEVDFAGGWAGDGITFWIDQYDIELHLNHEPPERLYQDRMVGIGPFVYDRPNRPSVRYDELRLVSGWAY